MAKKNKIRFTYDSPVILSFVIICSLLYILDAFFLNGKINAALMCPASKVTGKGIAFNFNSALDYLKMAGHIFATSGWNSFFINMGFLLVMGPLFEERYGSVIIIVMILVTTMVSGVLTACVSPLPASGQEPLVFMMIFLSMITAFTKKVFPLSSVLLVAVFTGYECCMKFSESKELVTVASICVALMAGLTGSLFGYLVSPKKKAEKKTVVKENSDEEDDYYESPKKKNNHSSDETIIGVIH